MDSGNELGTRVSACAECRKGLLEAAAQHLPEHLADMCQWRGVLNQGWLIGKVHCIPVPFLAEGQQVRVQELGLQNRHQLGIDLNVNFCVQASLRLQSHQFSTTICSCMVKSDRW